MINKLRGGNESKLRKFFVPTRRKDYRNSLILIGLFVYHLVIGGVGYELAKYQHEEMNMSRTEIESDARDTGMFQHVVNLGFWGRQSYYLENNLK